MEARMFYNGYIIDMDSNGYWYCDASTKTFEFFYEIKTHIDELLWNRNF